MKRNRFLSLLLSALILLTVVFPVGAFAGDWEEETFGSAEEYCWDEYVLQEENWDTYEEGNSSDEYVPYEETWATPEEDLTEQPSEDLESSEEDLPQEQDGQTEDDVVLEAEDQAEFAGVITITSQPVDQEVKENANATFTVEATGTGLTYLWYYSDNGGKSFTATKVDTPSWSFKVTAARNGRQVKCRIVDADGKRVVSDIAVATIKAAAIEITEQPTDQSAEVNKNVTFTIAATGTNLNYVWWCKDPGGSWRATSITGTSMSFKMTAARDGRQVKCVITDANGNVLESAVATATISAAGIVITEQPTDQSAEVNKNVTFTIAATGTNLNYVWWCKDPGGSWRATSITGTSMSFKMTAARDGRQVKCVITDADGNVLESAVATATISAIVIEGVTYEALTATTCKVVSYSGDAASLIIPGEVQGMTVTEIGEEAFMGNTSLTSIDLPDSITIIRARAFKNCTNLREMT